MPVTLAQAKLNTTDDLDQLVIDEYRKSSWLFDNLTFDDTVNPAGGGATLTFGYERVVTQPTAGFRAINAEYTPQESTKEKITGELKPFGGSFQIDRVLNAIAAGRETAFQMAQKIKAAKALFNDAVINGDTAVDANSFDGLDKALTGSTTELGIGVSVDWTPVTEDSAFGKMDTIDELLAALDGDGLIALLGNAKALAKIRSAARRAGYFTASRNEFGQTVEQYGNVVLIDPGKKAGSTDDVIPIETRDVDGAGAGGNITGLTDIYAVRLGLDGFHAYSLAGEPPVRQWLPDFDRAGAVKTGEVEMVAAVALKATKAAAVYRNIKVQ